MARETPQELYDRFLDTYLSTERLIFRPASMSWVLDGKDIDAAELAGEVTFDLNTSRQRGEQLIQRLSRRSRMDADDGIASWVLEMERQPANDTALRSWLQLMQRPGTTEEMAEAHVWAMKQWMWQVKRHIVERSVTFQVMPILWCQEQGAGKSYNLRYRLLVPLAAYMRTMNVSELGEKFVHKMLAQTRVVFFDEFAGAEHVDKGLLKGLLTGRDLDGRAMYSPSGVHAKNRLSCIATSNLPPPHKFEDSTGARRLWSIHCHPGGGTKEEIRARRDALDAIQPDDLWRAVSVNEKEIEKLIPAPVSRAMKQVRAEVLTARSSLSEFIVACLEKDAKADRVKISAVQDAYARFCRLAAVRRSKATQAAIYEALLEHGIPVKNHGGKLFVAEHILRDPEDL